MAFSRAKELTQLRKNPHNEKLLEHPKISLVSCEALKNLAHTCAMEMNLRKVDSSAAGAIGPGGGGAMWMVDVQVNHDEFELVLPNMAITANGRD